MPIACPLPGGGRVYSYFIDAPSPALIDAGVSGSPPGEIATALGERGIRLEDVRYVVNTHGHWDHLGGDAVLRERGSTLAIHSADAELLRSRDAHMRGYWGDRLSLAGKPTEPGRALILEHIAGEVEPDRLLAHGDELDLGGDVRLTVVHVPGHSAGSVALWWEARRLLVVGDAVQGAGTTGSRCPFYVDPDAYRTSLARMEDLRAGVLCGGHEFRWGVDAAFVTGEAGVGQAFERSRAAEALLRAAAGSRDPFDALAAPMGWDARAAAPEPLGLTLRGYFAGGSS